MVIDIIFDISGNCDENAVEYVRVKFLNLSEKEKEKLSHSIKKNKENLEVYLLAIFAKLTQVSDEQWLFLPPPSACDPCYENVIYASIASEDSPKLTLTEIQKMNDEIEEIRLFAEIEINCKKPFTIGE